MKSNANILRRIGIFGYFEEVGGFLKYFSIQKKGFKKIKEINSEDGENHLVKQGSGVKEVD